MKLIIPTDMIKEFDKKSDKGHDHDNRYVMKGDMDEEISDIWDKIKYLEENGGTGSYTPVEITNFISSPTAGTYEVGTNITGLIFEWDVDKEIISATLTDCEVSEDLTHGNYNYPLSTDKTFTLTVNDGKKDVSKSLSFNFLYRCYFGICNVSENESLNETLISERNSELRNGNSGNVFTIPNGYGYVYYCYPEVWGTLYETSFYINGFTGGFIKVGNININGVTCILWRSNQLLTCTDMRVEIK